ncbi:MAG TPA: hypothetical protein VH352_26870 [Pseudonocardiaceae bacterium]|jgi:hypothetical protein|nr:hypothetical protein [Pseudonocardiaceae bacterium]
MSRSLLPVVLGAVLLVTACSGNAPAASGGTSQVPKAVSVPGAPAGSEVENAVRTAFLGATAVHIKGTLTNNTGSLSLDLQLNKDNTASGTISEGGAAIPVLSAGGKFYVQFTPQLISQSTNSAVGQAGAVLTNKWVSSDSPLASSMVAGLKPLLTFDSFVSNMFAQTSAAPTLTGTDVVNNTPALVYESTDGSTVYIAKSSPHYLARMTAPASGSGSLDFTGWNQPVPVSPPPAAQIYTGAGS